ncbi:MAG: hypothetical protein GW917_03765, partial [Bdellovibrionales bacterium]|nr:hypothetical protein [Bdellovibrionales bacterium]
MSQIENLKPKVLSFKMIWPMRFCVGLRSSEVNMKFFLSPMLSIAVALSLCGFSSQSFADAVREDLDRSINQAADTGKKSQDSGAMMNMIAAGALTAACLAPCPKCQMALCAMAAMAAMQAANQSDASNASLAAFDASKYGSDYSGDYNTDGTDAATTAGVGTAGYSDPTVKKAMDKLKETGYKVTPDGVTFPDGTFQPASAFNSPSSMLAAGMGADAASAAGEALEDINKQIAASGGNVAAMAVDSAGGYASGGGGGGGSSG